MQFNIHAPNPSALLRGTLATLAEKFGGYKDGDDFLDLFSDLVEGDDPILTRNGAHALRDLVNRSEGATAAYQLEDTQEALFVPDEVEDPHAKEDANIEFLAPDANDLENLSSLTGVGPMIFTLPNGPEGLFRDGEMKAVTGTIRFPDFGPGGDVFQALFGNQAKPRTLDDVMGELDPIERITLLMGLGPQVFTMPLADVEEEIAQMRSALSGIRA